MAFLCGEDEATGQSQCDPVVASGTWPSVGDTTTSSSGAEGASSATDSSRGELFGGLYGGDETCVPTVTATGDHVDLYPSGRLSERLPSGESAPFLDRGTRVNAGRDSTATVDGCDGEQAQLGPHTLAVSFGATTRLDEKKVSAADTELVTPDKQRFLDTLAGR